MSYDTVKCELCGKELRSLNGHLRVHNITSREYKEQFPNAQFCSDAEREKCSKAGTISHEKHPELRYNFLKLSPEERHQNGVKGGLAHAAKYSGTAIKSYWSSLTYKLHPGMARENALKGLQTQRKNKSRERAQSIFMDCVFDSKNECNTYRIIYEKGFADVPIERKNVHVRVGGKEFDYVLKDKVFVDYHVFNAQGSLDEYYEQRRKILDENGFRNNLYIIVPHMRKINEAIEKIRKAISETPFNEKIAVFQKMQIDANAIIEMYNKQNVGLTEVAKYFDCDPCVIKRILKERNVLIKTLSQVKTGGESHKKVKLSLEEEQEIIEMYSPKNVGLKQVSEKTGYNPNIIRRVLIEKGINIKSYSEVVSGRKYPEKSILMKQKFQKGEGWVFWKH